VASLIALIASVAALDSVNPSTLGPALFMAAGQRPRRDVAAFAVGVLGVSAAGGLALLFGPGRAVLANIATPSPRTQHLVEAATGAALIGAAALLWLLRHPLGRRLSETHGRAGGSAFVVGATIMAVELPTAFPYFAGLLAIVESRRAAVTEVALVLLYNFVFVAPLVALLALVAVGGQVGKSIARRARLGLEAHAKTLAPATLGVIGAVLLAIGGSRL
jgi:cytochrome c biogenesis protein CcdA